MFRFFLVILFVLFSFLAVDAEAASARILKASYIAKKRAIRIHVASLGNLQDKYELHVKNCAESFPLQCSVELRRQTSYPIGRKLIYTWLTFDLNQSEFNSREYSRAVLTIYGWRSSATIQLPEIN